MNYMQTSDFFSIHETLTAYSRVMLIVSLGAFERWKIVLKIS
jgi:hypothetical protein